MKQNTQGYVERRVVHERACGDPAATKYIRTQVIGNVFVHISIHDNIDH